MLLVILFPEVSCAQVIAGKEFKPRTSQLTTPVGQSVYNVKGNFAMVGNTNLTLQNYSDTRVNGGNAMIYVDVDGDANTINSSSATLSFSNENGADPSCSNVVYAGLYWTGRAHNSGNSPMEFTVGEVTTDLNNGNSMSGYTLSMVAVNEDQGAGTSDGRLATYTFTPTGGGQVVVFRFRSWYEGSFWPTYKGTMTVQVGAGTETPLNGSLVNTSSNNYTFNFDNAYPIGTGNQSFKINSIRKRRTDNGINANYRVSVTKEGKLLNKRQVQFKKAGGSYQPIIANANDIYYPDNTHGNMYSAYADVTDIVKAGGQGEYFVADMALTAGTGDGTGYYGGWGLVVVYENSKMKWRDITVFDGHAYMSANGNNQTLDVSGFQSVQTGDVGVKIGMMAGEGDQEYTGDAFDIRSSSSSNANPSWKELLNQAGQTNNFFNSRIVGVPNRNPNLTNNSGVDIKVMELNNSDKSYITNNQTSTRFRYRTDGDTYIIFNIVFAVDAYVPEVQPVNSVITVNGNPYVPGSLVSPGDEIGYKLEVKNLGTEAINNAKVRIPVPYTAANYVVGSAIGQRHVATGSTATPFFNPIDGSLGAINWDIGTLPLPSNSNDILATLTYKFKVTEDCFLLSNPICTPTLAVTGTVSGTGATTNASLGNSGTFISGFQNAGACVGEPIHDPVKLGIAVGDRCKDYEYEARNFSICDGSTPQNILATVRAGFPSGTRFYSAVDAEGKGTGTEYNDTTPFPTNAPNATYYAIPPGAAGCYFEFKLKVIIVNTPPTTGSTDPLKYCVGETAVPLVATASSTSYNLYYYRGIDGNGNPTGVAETSITPSTSTAGTFEYYVTQGTADCQSPVSKITVIISAPPVISEPIENLILCEGSTGSVSVTAPGNNLTYTWEYYNGTAWVVLPNGTQDKITVSGNILTLTGASLAYNGGKVRVKVSNGKCSVVSEEALITINALPVVSAITGPNAVCIGSTVALSSTPTGGVWSSSNTSVATVSNTGVVTGVSAGTVTIRYTVTNGSGCSTVVTKDITVNALPVVSAITGSNSVCIGSTVALSSTPTGGVWSSSNTSVATVSTSGVVT
ncbi:Ig-like domain-containing protein, partial [Sphingobacterium paucimobilis]